MLRGDPDEFNPVLASVFERSMLVLANDMYRRIEAILAQQPAMYRGRSGVDTSRRI
jgi:hypothetical protein